jgi:hypothetical protein
MIERGVVALVMKIVVGRTRRSHLWEDGKLRDASGSAPTQVCFSLTVATTAHSFLLFQLAQMPNGQLFAAHAKTTRFLQRHVSLGHRYTNRALAASSRLACYLLVALESSCLKLVCNCPVGDRLLEQQQAVKPLALLHKHPGAREGT